MENKNESFSYTYSAAQQEEIKKIRSRYMAEEEDKMQQLRRLDSAASKKGMIVALTLGIAGSLILGGGMSLCLVGERYIPGIILGILGIIPVALAYPVYTFVTERQRKKIAPEILRLTDELMK